MDQEAFVYRGSKTNEISFPLGGIGTGCIGLAGNGRESGDGVLDARVLQGDLHPPYVGTLQGGRFNSFGFGPRREYLTGVPHFRDVAFKGTFPIAELSFVDGRATA